MLADGPTRPAPVDGVGRFGASARAFAGPTVGLLVGMDGHLGASLPAGALYDFDLMPVGLGLFGHGVLLGALGGVGVGGVIDRVPVGLQLPVEALVDAELGTAVHFGLWARVTWVVGPSARDHGAAHAPFGDELSTGAMLRIGQGESHRRYAWGNGPFIAATYTELMGAHGWGGLIGYSITMAQYASPVVKTHPTRIDRDDEGRRPPVDAERQREQVQLDALGEADAQPEDRRLQL